MTTTRKMKDRTEWDFELKFKPDGLSDLYYTVRSCIVSVTLDIENENGWKRRDEHLLPRIGKAG